MPVRAVDEHLAVSGDAGLAVRYAELCSVSTLFIVAPHIAHRSITYVGTEI